MSFCGVTVTANKLANLPIRPSAHPWPTALACSRCGDNRSGCSPRRIDVAIDVIDLGYASKPGLANLLCGGWPAATYARILQRQQRVERRHNCRTARSLSRTLSVASNSLQVGQGRAAGVRAVLSCRCRLPAHPEEKQAMGKGEGPGGRPNVSADNTIDAFLATTMNDYGHCFRSSVERFADAGQDRDYYHSAQVSPRHLTGGVYANKEHLDRADGVGQRDQPVHPTRPAYSSPREQRFVTKFTTADVDPKWTMEHDSKAWTDRGGLVGGNTFGKEQRQSMSTQSYCNGQLTEHGAPERSGKNNLKVNSHRSKFESRIDRFGQSPPREEKFNDTMRAKTARAEALRGPGIHDQGNGRGPKQTYDWRNDHFMKRPNSVFVLPEARARPNRHMASAGSPRHTVTDGSDLGPGSYSPDTPTAQVMKDKSRPSAAFRVPSTPVGHRSPYHKGPDSTWSLKTDARNWTKNRRGFAWGGGRAERPLNDRLTQRGAVATRKIVPAKC